MNAPSLYDLQSNLDRAVYDKNNFFYFPAHQLYLGKSSTHESSSYHTLHIDAENIALVYPFSVA